MGNTSATPSEGTFDAVAKSGSERTPSILTSILKSKTGAVSRAGFEVRP
jgi:hypothetical protein